MSIRNAKACRTCYSVVLSKDEPCPICHKTDDFSPNWGGLIIVLDKDKSTIAKKVNHTVNGIYAIRVRN